MGVTGEKKNRQDLVNKINMQEYVKQEEINNFDFCYFNWVL